MDQSRSAVDKLMLLSSLLLNIVMLITLMQCRRMLRASMANTARALEANEQLLASSATLFKTNESLLSAVRASGTRRES